MKNTDLSKKGKTMRKTIQTYLSGFKIETFSPVSMALWVSAMAMSLYTPHEGIKNALFVAHAGVSGSLIDALLSPVHEVIDFF